MGEAQNQPFQLSFNPALKVEFQGSRVTSDGGLILVRELDARLGFSDLIAPWVATSLGYAYVLSGRIVEGLQLLEEGLEHATHTRFLFGQSLRTAWLGEAYLRSGRMEDAARQAEHPLALARTHRERGFEAWALRFLGEIAAHHDPEAPAKAEDSYRQAMGVGDQLEMRPLVAHCHLGLGRLYHGTGDGAKAQEHVTIAATMFREMDMGYWLEKAKAELGPHDQ